MEITSLLLILLGLTLLVVGGEFLVRSSVALSFKLKLSKMVIGLTVVSFATSAPELIVSLQAALDGFSDISLGNVIGSNIANIGLVLGITAVISPLWIDRDFYRWNWPILMFFSIALFLLLKSGNELTRVEGFGLLVFLSGYLALLIYNARKNYKGADRTVNEVDETLSQVSNFKIVIWLGIGILALWGGSEWLVQGAVELATNLGISERVIAVTMIAVGTSVPELAASVMAALKKEKAISLGNLIGSNIFNIGCVLGFTSLIHPIAVKSQEVISVDIYWMLGFAAIILPIALVSKRHEIGRAKGFVIVVAYATFLSMTFLG
jgi:cation:H+ antiporter